MKHRKVLGVLAYLVVWASMFALGAVLAAQLWMPFEVFLVVAVALTFGGLWLAYQARGRVDPEFDPETYWVGLTR